MKKFFGYSLSVLVIISVLGFLFIEAGKSEYVCVKPHGYLGIVLLEKNNKIGKSITVSVNTLENDCKVDVMQSLNAHADNIADLLEQGITVKGICVAIGESVATLTPPTPAQDAQ